jgi:hypothetical protein
VSYASAVAEILAVRPRSDRRRRLIARSDALLRRLEQVNLDAYLPARPEQPVRGGRKIVSLPTDLAQAVSELLTAVGLPARRLWTTTDALESVWTAQRRILGEPDDEEEV